MNFKADKSWGVEATVKAEIKHLTEFLFFKFNNNRWDIHYIFGFR